MENAKNFLSTPYKTCRVVVEKTARKGVKKMCERRKNGEKVGRFDIEPAVVEKIPRDLHGLLHGDLHRVLHKEMLSIDTLPNTCDLLTQGKI